MPPDSLRAVLDSVFADPAYRWTERPEPLVQVRRWLAGLAHWLTLLRDHNPLGYRFLMLAMLVVLVAILVHAAWVLVRTIRPSAPAGEAAVPVALRRDREWYRREAARLAASGRFVEAMQADFLGLVLALDAAALLKYHPAKTPREYTREPGLGPPLRAELLELVGALYGYGFARRPCGPAEYDAFHQRVMEERHAPAL